MNRLGNPGRWAGLLYLLVSIPGAFALMYVPDRVIVHGNAAATLGNLVAHDTLIRLGIAAQLVSQVLFMLLALALYDLLHAMQRRLAGLMVLLVGVSVPVVCLNELNALAAVLLVHENGLLSMMDPPQRTALAMLFLRLHGAGLDIASMFWGLWLLPLGALVYRSRVLPRMLGVLLIGNGASYVANSVASLAVPGAADAVARWMMPLGFGELLFMAWLLTVGARQPGGDPA